MKKITIATVLLVILIPNIAFSQVIGFDGGIKDDYIYKEILFITGEPILVEGEVEIRESIKDDAITTTYTYELENTEEEVEVKRRVRFTTDLYNKEEKNQTVAVTKIDSFSERITVGDDRYTLEDYQFSRSIVYDNRPAVEFYSGNLSGKKVYSLNRNEGRVVVETNSDTIVGYSHYWGASETYILNNDIYSERTVSYTDDDGELVQEQVEWDGLVTLKLSSTDRKNFSYIENKPTNISFRGGLLQTERQENILQYTYDLPSFDDDGFPYKRKRNEGKEALRLDTVPVHKRLIIPNLKDIQGHWAEEYIFTLYSLEVIDDPSPYFGPGLPMTREEFARAVVRAISPIGQEEEEESKRRSIEREEPEEIVFEDIEEEDENYKYIKYAKEKGIMMGTNEEIFSPHAVLTRAQAITILIRSLGLEGLAPNPPYKTSFADDDAIPYWAKDSIYVASEIGLLTGDPYNRVNPNEPMTKAEAAAFIYRFIKHIKDDITLDYRERILNY